MSSIYGIHGYNRQTSSVNKLFAVYGNDLVDVDSGLGYQQNLTSGNNGEFATYLDYDFFVNGVDATRSFNGTAWSTIGLRNRAPIAKYARVHGVQLYLANIKIASSSFPSRVWKTDLPRNYDAVWGLEYGSTLSQTANSAVVTADGSYFLSTGIKVGDPVFILDGLNQGEYEVLSIDSNNQITLTKQLLKSQSNSNYIIGSNYFDVRTDDNDAIKGLGENSNRLLIFKLFTLHRYDGSSLVQVPGALGTSSNRSIVNVNNTYYFHGSQTGITGIYKYNGTESVNVSLAIQPYIDGISSSNFGSVVGWREGNWARMYVGDITNSQRSISVSKAVLSYDELNNGWSVDPISKVPTCSTVFMENGAQKTFFGDDSARVEQTPSGYSFDGSDVAWAIETGPQYPMSSEMLVKFTRIQVIARDARGANVRYRLYNNPRDVDDQWYTLGQIQNDKTEFLISQDHCRASGIECRIDDTDTKENTPFVEKLSFFYLADNTNYV